MYKTALVTLYDTEAFQKTVLQLWSYPKQNWLLKHARNTGSHHQWGSQTSLKYSQHFCPKTGSPALLQNQVSRLQLLLHRPPPEVAYSMNASKNGFWFSLRKSREGNENAREEKEGSLEINE